MPGKKEIAGEDLERMTPQVNPALCYLRRLFANMLDWYKNADTKAQVVLTLDGAFLSFISGSLFIDTEDLKDIIDRFGFETWSLLLWMVLTLLGSIYAALACLRSRLSDPDDITHHLRDIVRDPNRHIRQRPETLWFFGHIAQLEDREGFRERMEDFTESDEISALSSQVFLVSRNVMRKHLWVNRAFLFAAATLMLFLAAAVSYVARTAM